AQINTTVGDLDGNRERILTRLTEAKQAGADVVLFPELAVTGYPPEDLLLRPSFVEAAEESLAQIARETRGIVAFVGTPHLALAGAQLIVNISASPFHVGKEREREQMLQTRARDNVCYVAFVNAVGAQDELVFDGHSVVLDDEGEVLARAPGFEEALLVVDV